MSLQTGSSGPDVQALQNQLIKLGYSLTADGSYGPQTAAAVMQFQAAHHLQQDGIAGPVTQSVINAALNTTSVYGIDVSVYQGAINWDAVKASGSVNFAYIKCTDGDTTVDPRFASNLAEAKRVGMVYGAYHFFRFLTSDPLKQAALLKATAGPANFGTGTLPIAVDVEYQDKNGTTNATVTQNRAQYAADLLAFVNQVTADFGRPPVLYTTADFWNNVLMSPPGFNNLKLWIAQYSAAPTIPHGWTNYSMWQYGSTGTISGITGAVDLDVVSGGMSGLVG